MLGGNHIATKTNFAQARSEDDDFEQLAHLLQELINAWPFDDIDVMPLPLNFDRYDVVALRNELDSAR